MSSWVIVIGCHQMPSADVIVVACCVHCGQRHCGQNCCLFGLHYLLPHFALSPLPPPTTNIDTTRIYSHHQCQNHFQHQHHHRPLQHQHVKQCETIRSTPKKMASRLHHTMKFYERWSHQSCRKRTCIARILLNDSCCFVALVPASLSLAASNPQCSPSPSLIVWVINLHHVSCPFSSVQSCLS